MKRVLLLLVAFMMSWMVSLPGYSADSTGVNMKPKTPEEWRTYLRFRRDEALEELYRIKPEAKAAVEKAEGYAVFTNFKMKILLVGTGSGRGFVHDNKSGKETFMRMVEAGAGLGMGVQDFRAVFIFTDRAAMESFITSGWAFGGDASAAVKGGDTGDAATGAVQVAPGISVYRLVENGLALDVMAKGTKYWVDEEMNSGK